MIGAADHPSAGATPFSSCGMNSAPSSPMRTSFADLFPKRGQPGLAPWRLALVTLLQFRENLADRRAAEAVRARIDWKYVLGLELADPGFDASVPCEFRTRLIEAVPRSGCCTSCSNAAR